MSYLGRQLTSGNYLKLDDISSQFNGSTKTFNLTSGGNLFYPGSAYSILVVLGGVVQEPESAYTIDQYQITFASAPGASDDFFCIVLGVALGIGVPGDRTVTGDKLSQPFNYNSGQLTLDTVNDRVGINSSTPGYTLDITGDINFNGLCYQNGSQFFASRWTIGAGTTIYRNSFVGIGTTQPTSALDVQSGTIKIGSNTLSSSGISTFTTLNATTVSSTSIVVSSGSTSAPSISPSGNSNTGIFFPSPDTIAFAEGGAEALRIDSNSGTLVAKQLNISGVSTFGNTVVVGGATTQLIVNGNARITGILTVGTSSLTFDGNANTITGLSTITGSSNFAKPNLSGISSTISSTAVDVFVYDTRKDSDGGQWRKRTQHTSWYNETLNTATRGSRRDFPAVAILVLEAGKLTIYDADDPDMPMWMVFNTGKTNPGSTVLNWWTNQDGLTVLNTTFALNGKLVVGVGNGIVIFDFISDDTRLGYGPIGSDRYELFPKTIITRNGFTSQTAVGNGYVLVNTTVNDVAMTVLPNAPIDSATGLPIPTIAVATNGGTSIIRDDGTVANITYDNFNVANLVHFTKNNKIATFTDSGTGGARFYRIYDIPSFNLNGGAYNNMGSALRAYNGDTVSYNYPIRYMWYSNTTDTGNFYANALVYAKDGPVFGRNGRGIALISEGNTNLPGETIPTLSTSAGMVCGISSSVNTGWMHGDIKGAWLSDTSTANVTGTELITNGTFDSNVTGWTANTSTNTWSSGTMQIARTGGSGSTTYQTFTTVAGQRYIATAQVNSSGSRGDMYVLNGTGWGGTTLGGALGTSGQTRILTVTFIASSTTTSLGFAIDNNGTSIFVDNVSVRLAEADRSVNNNGLQVFGTITKTPVATGSNLIGYSGWSTSNYLQQPYNSSIALGATDSLCIMAWTKQSSAPQYAVIYATGELTGGRGRYLYMFQGIPYLDTYGGAGNQGTRSIADGVWHYVVGIYTPQGGKIYVDGQLFSSPTLTQGYLSQTGTSYYSRVGIDLSSTADTIHPGSIALVRVSNSVPSPEQIRKIYEDEKALFQPNSQCTLYGSSDAVTALAYDDTTKLLSVGTSSGRSDFQGLERINNTTTAVTTAISASNGLIAEQ